MESLKVANFQFGDLCLQVNDASDPIFQGIREVFSLEPAKEHKSPDAVLEIAQGELFCPDEGAIRTRWRPTLESEYRLGGRIFDIKEGEFSCVKDYDQLKMKTAYRERNARNVQLTESALKWLLIKLAEKNGYTYVHASAVSLRGTILVFCGESGAGKSSCLLRMMNRGGEILTDDSLLIREDCILRFDALPSNKGDFSRRFSVEVRERPQKTFSPGVRAFDHRNLVLVFPHIRYSKRSLIERLAPSEAYRFLWRTYSAEMEFNALPKAREFVTKSYEALFSHCPHLAFFAGEDEEEAERTLFEGILPYINHSRTK